MADHDAFPQVQLDGSTWTDVTTDVLQGETYEVDAGYAQEGTVRPTKIRWTFNNQADVWRPSSPTSPLYVSSGRRMKAAAAMDGIVLAVGEASKYEPDETLGASIGKGFRWVGFEAEGLLRRLGTWSAVLRSPLYRHITGYTNLRGYWPMEDGRDAVQSANAYRGGKSGYVQGITFEAAGPLGSERAAQVAASGTALASGWFSTMSQTNGYQIHMLAKLKQLPTLVTSETMFRWGTTSGLDIQWNVNNASYTLTVFDQNGTQLLSSAVLYGVGAEPNQFVQFQWKVSQVGSDVTVVARWNTQGDNAPTYNLTFTIPNATVGRPTWWRVVGNPYTTEMIFGHIFAVTGTTDSLISYAMSRAFDGYVGEVAIARFQRLMDAAGLPWEYWGTTNESVKMGRQRSATLLELLKEIADTDDGLIFDRHSNTGVHFRSRRNLYQQTPKITLQYGVHIGEPLREVIDDVGTGNVVTVKQVAGSEFTAALDSGPMSSAPPPAGIGEQEKTFTVNVADEYFLESIAYWRLARGTVLGSRWPTVTIDLDRPGVTAGDRTIVAGLTEGDRVKITGRTPEPIDLMVIGIKHRLSTRYRRTTVLTCIPYDVFRVGIYHGTSGHRYALTDSVTTTNLAVGSGGTYSTTHATIYEASPSGSWGTNTPYDIMITGERMTVNSVFTSGSGQGLNVTRSVNGVVKTHGVGEPITLADAVRYAL
jgi:hypothetical protein